MSKSKASFPWPQLIIAVLVFIIVIILGFRNQASLLESVIDPIRNLLSTADSVLKSIDQRCIWWLALLITLVLSLRTLRLRAVKGASPLSISPNEAPSSKDRVKYWKKRVEERRGDGAQREYYLSDFPWLVLNTLAYHHQTTPEEIKRRIRSGNLDVPSSVREILWMDDPTSPPPQRSGTDIRFYWSDWFRNLFKKHPHIPDSRLESVAAFLESLSEEVHDD